MRREVILILVINVGSTSTRVSVFRNETPLVHETIRHPAEELKMFADVWEQYDFRMASILQLLEDKGFLLKQFDAVASRGGTGRPIPGGVYAIDEPMLSDMKGKQYGTHPTNVGCHIAYDLARQLRVPALTVDPPVVDEMCRLARYSGIPQIERKSSFHALNQKATARRAAQQLGKPYERLSLIVAHLGGGISVAAHRQARVVDVNNALNGDGPFSPERAGTLPAGDLIDLCFSGRYSKEEMHRLICGGGGLMAYLGTTDIMEIEERIQSGDQKAREVLAAMAYQVAKEIGAAAAVLDGRVDAVVLTGSLAGCRGLVDMLEKKIGFIAPVCIFAGENEMEALAHGALRFMRGEEQARQY